MTKIDWTKAKPLIGIPRAGSEISDAAASDDQEFLDAAAKKRRRALDRIPANWLKTGEEVRAFKDALKGKKK
jgi:hypothetical protein